MRTVIRFALAAAILAGVATAASAQSVMKQCGDQWQAAKQAGSTNGETWPQFLKDCRAHLGSTTSAPAQGGSMQTVPTPPVTQVAPAPAAPATAYVKTASQCDADYAANRAAIRASGQTKREFVAACRQGSETIPQGAAAAPAPAPAPAQTGSLFPWQQPAAPAPASPNPSARSDHSRRSPLCAGGSIPLPRSDSRLGERALAHLSLRRNPRLRQHEAGRVYVRSRRSDGRQSRRHERKAPLTLEGDRAAAANRTKADHFASNALDGARPPHRAPEPRRRCGQVPRSDQASAKAREEE